MCVNVTPEEVQNVHNETVNRITYSLPQSDELTESITKGFLQPCYQILLKGILNNNLSL